MNIIEVTLMSAYGSAAQVLSDEVQVLDADGYTFAYQLASNVNVDSQLPHRVTGKTPFQAIGYTILSVKSTDVTKLEKDNCYALGFGTVT